MVDNPLPPLDAQKGQKVSGFAVQPVISTRSGFFLSVFPAWLNHYSLPVKGVEKKAIQTPSNGVE